MRNVHVIVNAVRTASSVCKDNQTNTRVRNWWEILKFSPELKQPPSQQQDLSPIHQTSEISLKTSDLILKHQKWQHWWSAPFIINPAEQISSGVFEENVRNPVWICRDPMIIFSDSRDPNRVPKTPLKNPGLAYFLEFSVASVAVLFTAMFCVPEKNI